MKGKLYRSKKTGGLTGRGFVPGQSGNPKGRPKNIKYISELMRECGALRFPKNEQRRKLLEFFGLPEHKEYTIDFVTALAARYGAIMSAMKGNITPLSVILERLEGKVSQPLGDPDPETGKHKITASLGDQEIDLLHELLKKF